ncbi:MAG TPA: gamma-glutamyl-gamma-aminobutyrate hydrolase family protein [Gemmatimonadales bacterium]|nr:gamma-glutamyl-gamma-aminobutyrate hydrolase family protein [Gemmatimonadales bacterium]
MSAPRIGVSGVVRQWDGNERTGVNAAYVRSVLAAGGVPVILSPVLGPSYAARAMDGLDGLLLSGGEDIHPALYGAELSPHCYPPSRERDLFELALFAAARQRELPVLGICRGIQLVNVGMGGTLYQHLPTERPSEIAHDAGSARDARTHGVRLAAGSRAAQALGATELRVNSFHHQAVDRLAPGLVATGWSDDGVIEAAEGPGDGPWLLTVQWHPEEMHAEVKAPERGLFRALVEASACADSARRG